MITIGVYPKLKIKNRLYKLALFMAMIKKFKIIF